MQKTQYPLIALFDASPEHAHFESPIVALRAMAIGKALAKAHLGVVARLGSSVAAGVLGALGDATATSIVLSPANNRMEHERAYRLPHSSHPTIFTGKGALGTDMMALASAHGILIFGSYPGALENVLDYAKDSNLPIGILTDEDTGDIHERVRTLHPHMTAQLFVSHDPHILARELANELRRRSFNVNIER